MRMFRFVNSSPQVARLVNGIRIREQEPFASRLLGRGPNRICFSCPAGRQGRRVEHLDARQAERDGAGLVGRAVIHQPQFPVLSQGKAFVRLGQQRLEAWPENIGLIAGGHDDGEMHRRSSFPRISCAARGSAVRDDFQHYRKCNFNPGPPSFFIAA